MKKRFLGILSLIMALCICTAISASAQAPGGDVARPTSNIYTGVNGTLENGYAEFPCTLTKRLSTGYVEAYVQNSNSSGTVECYIKRPSGEINYVGVTAASGGTAGPSIIHSMEAGNYTFIFIASTNNSLSVNAIIYD